MDPLTAARDILVLVVVSCSLSFNSFTRLLPNKMGRSLALTFVVVDESPPPPPPQTRTSSPSSEFEPLGSGWFFFGFVSSSLENLPFTVQVGTLTKLPEMPKIVQCSTGLLFYSLVLASTLFFLLFPPWSERLYKALDQLPIMDCILPKMIRNRWRTYLAHTPRT